MVRGVASSRLPRGSTGRAVLCRPFRGDVLEYPDTRRRHGVGSGALHWGPGTGRAAEQPDDVEPLWVRYYGAMFNPDRVNPRVMRAQMPERYWATLPETTIIDELVTPPDDAKRTPRTIQLEAGQNVAQIQHPAAEHRDLFG